MTDAKQHYLAGLKLFGAEQPEAAIAEYDLALAARPDWIDVLLAKAMARATLGQHEQAIETVQRVIELTPDDPWPSRASRSSCSAMNKIPEAETAQAKARMISWKEELKTNPNAPPPEDPKGIRVVQ